MRIRAVGHDGDDPGHVVAGVGQQQAGPPVQPHQHAHHDVLLLGRQHCCGAVPARDVLPDVSHGLLAR